MTKRSEIIKKLFYEATSYQDLKDLDKLFETDIDLSSLPIQPLYLLLKSAPLDSRATVLAKLTPNQRQAIYDIEGWNRDDIDFNAFNELPLTIIKSGNLEVIQEFAQGDLFLLYLKGNFTIRTFDPEEANYPDHDNFFLTDDGAFVIEYNEDCECIKEVQYLVKNLYAYLGVSGAYNLLIELINLSYMSYLEDQYQIKKERLRAYGFVDAYEAKEIVSEFRTKKQLTAFIDNKTLTFGKLSALSKSQALHSKSMRGLVDDLELFADELAKVKEDSKIDFLQFDFIRLVNSTLAIRDAFKKGSLMFTKVNKETKTYLKLGFEYCLSMTKEKNNISIFETFTFMDLYKVGKTLVSVEKNNLKKALSTYDPKLEDFMGSILDDTFDIFSSDPSRLGQDLKVFNKWSEKAYFSIQILPYVNQFFVTYNQLLDQEKLNDNFYINYKAEEIDFEAIIISSFINFSLGFYKDKENQKMGLSIDELKKWAEKFLTKKDDEYILGKNTELMAEIKKFKTSFGINIDDGFEDYLLSLIDHHITGYEYSQLDFDDFKHIGGAILLNIN